MRKDFCIFMEDPGAAVVVAVLVVSVFVVPVVVEVVVEVVDGPAAALRRVRIIPSFWKKKYIK